jgi:hypothetical protein
MAPAVMMMSSQPERYAVSGRSHTSSHTKIAANRAHKNHGPHTETARQQHRSRCEDGHVQGLSRA